MKDKYLLSTRQEQNQSMERRILDTAQKVTTITEGLSTADVAKRLGRLEEQVSQSAKALQWIMDSLKSQGHHAEEEPPQLTVERESQEVQWKSVEREETGFHVNARLFYYPGTKVTRFPVPEEMVPWKEAFTSYKPSFYTSDESEDHIDGEALQNYRNPGGRTGIMGRGSLTKLGANKIMGFVLTRCREMDRSALEFLAVWDQSHKSWALPGWPVQSEGLLPAALQTTMGRQLYQKVQETMEEGTKGISCNAKVVKSRGSTEGVKWQEVSEKKT
ncbi:hypothetical protein CRUP_021644, partial [Coryphaenoides rupestris]